MAVEHNFTFRQGDDVTARFDLWLDAARTVPFDPTGWSARMQIRRNPNAPVILELSTTNGLLDFEAETDDEDAVVKVYLKLNFISEDTSELPADTDLGYDIELHMAENNITQTVFAGTVTAEAEYTK